jgi:dynein heavy chain 1
MQLAGSTMRRLFVLIGAKVKQLNDYVAKWVQFRSLWGLGSEYVFNCLSDSAAHWQQLLTDIKRARTTFDRTET